MVDAGPPADAASTDAQAQTAPDATVDAAAEGARAEAARRKLWQGRLQLVRARALLEAEQLDEAIGALRAAKQDLPEDGWVLTELASACLVKGDYACARDEAREATKLAGDQAALEATAYDLLGQASKELGELDAARQAYRKARTIRPLATTTARLAELSEGGGHQPSAEPTCPITGEVNQPGLLAAQSNGAVHGRTLCSLLSEPYSERSSDGIALKTYLLGAFERHREASELLGEDAGLGANGAFPLILVRIVREQPEVVVLDTGRSERQGEIVHSLEAEIRRIILGPSRPGLAIEVTTRGWWHVGRGEVPYAFERHEVYVVGQHLSSYANLTSQVTLERGQEAVEDCLYGSVSRPLERRGTIWLEDLDLSGVPEICQETLRPSPPRPDWLGEGAPFERIEATCQRWIASELQRSTAPVPSLELDDFDRDRAVHQVLEFSRVPAPLRNTVRAGFDRQSIISAKALELTTSGMRALAITASETDIKALAVSAGDAINLVDLGKIGRWRDLEAEIDASNPALVAVKITARGEGLDGGAARRWLHLLRAEPGQPPRLALSVEVAMETPLGADPCPHSIVSEIGQEDREGTEVLSLTPTKRSGPGSSAEQRTTRALCELLSAWQSQLPDGGLLPSEASLPQTAEQFCPVTTERLPVERYAQAADGRFVRTTLPVQ